MKTRFIIIQLLLISSLSTVLRYPKPDFKDANWDIAMFLTPFGIIKNYFEKDTTVMWSFYSDISTGQVNLTSMQMMMFAAVYVLLLSKVILYIRTEGHLK